MPDLKESVIMEFLKSKAIRWILICMIIIAFCYATLSHITRCSKGLNSRYLWGLSECEECKDTVTKINTIYKDTCIPKFTKSGTKDVLPLKNKISDNGTSVQSYGQKGGQTGRDFTNNYNKPDSTH